MIRTQSGSEAGKVRRGRILAILAVGLLASPVAYSSLIYNVNSTIGVGSVVGTLETDGTLGVLATANILDWNLTLNDGTGPFTLLGPLSGPNSDVLVNGTSFTASITALTFDFSNVNTDIVLFQNPYLGSGFHFWCLVGIFDGCAGHPSAETVTTGQPGDVAFAGRTGLVDIATASPVPILPAVWLFGSALGAMGWLRRKAA